MIRRLHSLTGIVFGGYIVIHLLVNATLVEGSPAPGEPSVFQLQVDKIHSLPFLLALEWVFIYLPIIYHTLYGLVITFTGQPNALSYPYAKNWSYFFQRVSAMVIALFIAFHLFAMKGVFGGELGRQLTFDPLHAAQSVAIHMHSAWWIGYVIYPIGILASCYHLANGFWTAAITWGLTVSKGAQRRWGYACAGLFILTLSCGTLALASALHQPVSSALRSDRCVTAACRLARHSVSNREGGDQAAIRRPMHRNMLMFIKAKREYFGNVDEPRP